jgi:hypothetical protein
MTPLSIPITVGVLMLPKSAGKATKPRTAGQTRLMQALDAAASGEELALGFQAIDTNSSAPVEFNELSDGFANR